MQGEKKMFSILKIKNLNNINNYRRRPVRVLFCRIVKSEWKKKYEKEEKIRLKPRLMIWKTRCDKEKLCIASFYPTFFLYRKKTTFDWKNQPLRVFTWQFIIYHNNTGKKDWCFRHVWFTCTASSCIPM